MAHFGIHFKRLIVRVMTKTFFSPNRQRARTWKQHMLAFRLLLPNRIHLSIRALCSVSSTTRHVVECASMQARARDRTNTDVRT